MHFNKKVAVILVSIFSIFVILSCDDSKSDSSGSQTPVVPTIGQLVITEIMPDPGVISDPVGEYIEFYNNSNQTLDITNLSISVVSSTGTVTVHTVNFLNVSDSIINSGEYVLIGKDSTVYTGMNATSATMTLGNVGLIQIKLLVNNEEIDFVSYTGTTPGRSYELDTSKIDYLENNNANDTNWHLATTNISQTNTDKGTPKAIND